MSHQFCPNCDRLFEGKDKVKAVIITYFVPLKSKRIYALERPEECLEITHQNCNWPKTGGPDGD